MALTDTGSGGWTTICENKKRASSKQRKRDK